ncbi:hypothetical protein RHECIAT_CH0002238 [Rhizobium etli CIAT 652]|uniref:Uncharacterized protein n=1 Tax=Rhizobium etli (strain CIAT 652) TaxID=491916 RepID=B3Q0J0_RHIE6|nr:hypothetical protein RHECIAT_CH0002238 [Rhizobium etli CIAT 652]KKZ89682.1 hypothetical protein RPHASCH2410_CH03490 [Rhizobium phaseoli Ch24-10]
MLLTELSSRCRVPAADPTIGFLTRRTGSRDECSTTRMTGRRNNGGSITLPPVFSKAHKPNCATCSTLRRLTSNHRDASTALDALGTFIWTSSRQPV